MEEKRTVIIIGSVNDKSLIRQLLDAGVNVNVIVGESVVQEMALPEIPELPCFELFEMLPEDNPPTYLLPDKHGVRINRRMSRPRQLTRGKPSRWNAHGM